MTGDLDFQLDPATGFFYLDGSGNLTFAGAAAISRGTSNTSTTTAPLFAEGTVFPGAYNFSVNTTNIQDLTYSDFSFSGRQATGGTAYVCGANCMAAPLPATFSLFGSALAVLGGIGWLNRRRRSEAIE